MCHRKWKINMDKIRLKDNIWIEGFDSELSATSTGSSMWFGKGFENLIYAGKSKDIPIDTANESVLAYYLGSNFSGDYEHSEFGIEGNKKMFATSMDAILSVCEDEYCLIYKI